MYRAAPGHRRHHHCDNDAPLDRRFHPLSDADRRGHLHPPRTDCRPPRDCRRRSSDGRGAGCSWWTGSGWRGWQTLVSSIGEIGSVAAWTFGTPPHGSTPRPHCHPPLRHHRRHRHHRLRHHRLRPHCRHCRHSFQGNCRSGCPSGSTGGPCRRIQGMTAARRWRPDLSGTARGGRRPRRPSSPRARSNPLRLSHPPRRERRPARGSSARETSSAAVPMRRTLRPPARPRGLCRPECAAGVRPIARGCPFVSALRL
jgi:hypothetical protein